jgi:PKD repeat protein
MFIAKLSKKLRLLLMAITAIIASHKLYAQDVGVISILSPQSGDCPGSGQVVKVIVKNFGSNSVSNIPVGVSVKGGSSSFSGSTSFSKTIKSGGFDTALVSGLNTTGGGKLIVKAWTSLSQDSILSDDSSSITAYIGASIPKTITAADSVICGSGYARISIPRQLGVVTGWFAGPSSQVLLDTGSFKSEALTSSKLYWPQSFSIYPGFTAFPKSTGYSARFASLINSIDVKTTSILDSMAFYFNSADTITLYYYDGDPTLHIRDSSGWIQLYSGPVLTKSNKNLQPGYIKFPPLLLKGGHKYGFYIYSKNSSLQCLYSSDPARDSVVSLPMVTHSLGASNFKWGSVLFFYTTSGGLYYRTFSPTCYSNRKQIYIRVKSGSYGASFKQRKPFRGTYNSGVALNPDGACTEDTVTYEVTPPAVYTNADYYKKWVVYKTKVTTQGGQVLTDTLTKAPSATSNFSIRLIPPAKYQDSTLTVSVTIATADTCVSTYTRVIKVNATPNVNFGSSDGCIGQQISFDDSTKASTGDYLAHFWDFGDGSTALVTDVAHVYQKQGSFNVKLTVLNSIGCSGTKEKTIQVYHKPAADFKTSPLCVGSDISFSDTSKYAGNLVSQYWKFPSGIVKTTPNPVVKFATAGNYIIRYAIQTNLGCTDTVVKTITIISNPAPKVVTRYGCVGEATLFTDTARKDKGSNYFWDFGDSATSTDLSPMHIFKGNGPYSVKLTVTNSSGCSSMITFQAQPFLLPIARFSFKQQCAGDPISFVDSSNYRGAVQRSIQWDFGDGTVVSGRGTPTHVYSKRGTYMVTLTIANNNGCESSVTKTIHVDAAPNIDFSINDVCVDRAVSPVNRTTSDTTIYYLWDFGDGTKLANVSPSHKYSAAGSYTITLQAFSGSCSSSLSKNITVYPIPSAKWHVTLQDRKFVLTADDSSASKYVWIFSENHDTLYGQKIESTIPIPGSHTVCLIVTSNGGCVQTDCDTFSVEGVEFALAVDYHLGFSPNPFGGDAIFTYTLPQSSITSASLLDTKGREVLPIKSSGTDAEGFHSLPVNADNLEAGIYILRFVSEGQCYHLEVIKD